MVEGVGSRFRGENDPQGTPLAENDSRPPSYKVQRMARDTTFSDGSSNPSLVRRLVDGSPNAWRDLVELYGPLVDRWCRAAGVPHDSVADIAQETFFAAFRGMHRFDPSRPGATFRGWLWVVARNRIRDHFRHRRPDAAAGGSTAAEKLEQLADSTPDEEPSDATDIARLAQRAMRRVEPEFEPQTWQVFLDAVVLGHPTHVVAERHSLSPAAVRQIKSRILRRLRQELGDA
jgi:RNA polymerase sigma-70 factor, ECF subfamily